MEYEEIIRRAYLQIKQKILEQVNLYVKKSFIDLSDAKFSISGLSPKEKAELEERLRKIQQTFPQYLLSCITKRGLSETEIYKKAHLDRRIFSKLRNEENYMPSERTLWAILLAMELNIDEAKEILNEGGFALSYTNKEDVIIRYFFEKRIYDIFLVNEVLDNYGFKPLN
ncbi:MAG: XRE family transcriptional regulator [Selenomonadaceae bacterium]|nr:XRE family transcriptional regulator [Selenomonadaceae bacterium]